MMIVNVTPRVLIPASGFGKRAGSPESKEMMLNPRTGEPLIASSLKLAKARGWPVAVLTRGEKRSLIDYLSSHWKVDVVMTGNTREWPETLARSREFWNEVNLVLLPDTEFEPTGAIDTLHWSLTHKTEAVPIAFGVFDVSDSKSWGMVMTSPEGENSVTEICEKPLKKKSGAKAWGLFGFHRDVGAELFQALLESSFDHEWKSVPAKSKTVSLSSFRDLTRNN